MGDRVTEDELLRRILAMVHEVGVHNLNFVTPDHFFPHVFRLVERLRRGGEGLPVVYNLSGYQSVSSLKAAEDFVDIYLPDFKYADAGLAGALSACRDYMPIALDALAEMVRQKGFLDGDSDRQHTARGGVLVRHLILPGHVANSLEALSSLYVEFGPKLPLSIMSQYCLVAPQRDERLNRSVHPDEFRRVYAHAGELGFERLFIQFPSGQPEDSQSRLPFLPDFSRQRPFQGGPAETADAIRNPRSPD
jgi:putative pyruvate formate lyase activating enzyme